MILPSFLRENARWLAGGFLLTLFSSYGQTFYIALSSGGVRDELALSHGEFGWIYMWATLTGALLIRLSGSLADTLRVERYAAFVILGLAGSMLLLSQAHNVVLVFVALAGLRMFGQGLMSHAAMTAMGRWFSATRGKAVSAAAMGHQLGESVMPISFVAIAALLGWRGGWIANAAFLLLIVLPAVYVLMRVPRTPHESGISASPAGRQWTRRETIRDPLFWLLIPGVLAPPLIGTVVFFHQQYLVEIRGWALGQFAGATPVISVFAIASTAAAGIVIDRFGSAVLLPVMLVFVAIANLTLASVADAWSILVFMAGMGTAFGIYATVFGAIWPEIYGTRHLGAIKSVVTSLMVVTTALGPGITGWLIDRGIAYPGMIAALGIYAIFASLLMIVAGRLVRRRLSLREETQDMAAAP